MAELLTNNPEAMKSLSGKSPTSTLGLFGGPCGIFWFSGCTYNNFNDWFGTLKSRYNLLKRNYQKLYESSKLPEIDDLTPEEVQVTGDINDIKEIIDDLNHVPQGLSRKEYYQKIATIQSALADTNALLEFVQDSIESRDERYFPTFRGKQYSTTAISTGIQRPWGWSEVIFFGGIAVIAGYGSYKLIKKVTT